MVVGDFAIELDTVVIGAGPGGYAQFVPQKWVKSCDYRTRIHRRRLFKRWMYSFKSFNCAGHHYQEAQDSSTFGVTAKGVELDFAKHKTGKITQLLNH